MQDYNTIIGVIQMRQNDCSFKVIQNRYHIGSGTVQLMLKRFNASGFSLEQLKTQEPSEAILKRMEEVKQQLAYNESAYCILGEMINAGI